MKAIHPKTTGAGLGAAIGTVIVSVLGSIHGVHLSAADNGGIVAALSVVLAYFAPAGTTTPVATKTTVKPVETAAPVA